MSSKEQIRELISLDRIDEAIGLIINLVKDDRAYLYNQILLYSNRWKKLKNDSILGIISNADHILERSKIVYSLLNLLDDVANYEEAQKSKNKKGRNKIYIKGNKNTVIQGVENTAISNVNNKGNKDFPRTRVLFLASNPTNKAKLELAEEFKIIAERLQENGQFNKFELYQEWAITPKKLMDSITGFKPHVIHFTGHGEKNDPERIELFRKLGREIDEHIGLIFLDDLGAPLVIDKKALGDLFHTFSIDRNFNIKVVILSACYTDQQAREISKYVPYTIGMSAAVDEAAALTFATGFYRNLANGLDIEVCYKLGRNLISLESLEDADKVVLFKKQ